MREKENVFFTENKIYGWNLLQGKFVRLCLHGSGTPSYSLNLGLDGGGARSGILRGQGDDRFLSQYSS